MIRLYDTTCAPDSYDVGIIDCPFVLFVGYIDYADSLDVGCKAGRVDCNPQVFDESVSLFSGWKREFGREERSMEGFLHALPIASECGNDT